MSNTEDQAKENDGFEHGVAPTQPLENKALYTDLSPFSDLKTCFLAVKSTL